MLRSLLYSHFSESLTGLPTIRSYGETERFLKDNQYYVDLEDRALFLTITNQRWMAIRLDFMGAILVFAVGGSICSDEIISELHGNLGRYFHRCRSLRNQRRASWTGPYLLECVTSASTSEPDSKHLSAQLTQICGMVTRQYAEVENYMNSVERGKDGKHSTWNLPDADVTY